jgi:hypothetical protein
MAFRCADDSLFTIPHLLGISTTVSLWLHHRCDFLFPAFSRYSSSTPLSSFFTAEPLLPRSGNIRARDIYGCNPKWFSRSNP